MNGNEDILESKKEKAKTIYIYRLEQMEYIPVH
jgi:hypothetical protein